MPYLLPSNVFSILNRELEIHRLEQRITRWVRSSPPSIRPMLHHQFNGLTKCFRPLTIFACHYAQTNDEAPESLIVLAHVIEIIHNVSLIIDDIVDESTTRRGKPTLHAKYDEMTAYMVSAYLFAEAYRILTQEIADEYFSLRPCQSDTKSVPRYQSTFAEVEPNSGAVDVPKLSLLDKDGLPNKDDQLALLSDDEGADEAIHAARTDMRLVSELIERLASAEVLQWYSRKDGTQRRNDKRFKHRCLNLPIKTWRGTRFLNELLEHLRTTTISRRFCRTLKRVRAKARKGNKSPSLYLGLKDWRFLAREDTGSMFEICACIGARSQEYRRVGRLIGMLYHASDDLSDLKDASTQQSLANHLSGGGDQDLIDGILTLPAALAIQRSGRTRRLFWTSPLKPNDRKYKMLLARLRDQEREAKVEFLKIRRDAHSAVAQLPVGKNREPLEALIEQVALLAQFETLPEIPSR